MIRQLFRQIQKLKVRLKSCSRRSRIIRRLYTRISFLLVKLQEKKLFFRREFDRHLHFIDVEKSELNIPTELWELISRGFSYIHPSYSLTSSEMNFFINNFSNRLFWFRHFRDNDSETAPLPLLSPEAFQMEEFCRLHRPRRNVKTCPKKIREKYPVLEDFLDQLKRVVWHNYFVQKYRLPRRHHEALIQLRALKADPRFLFRTAD